MAVKFKDTININGQYTLPEQDGTVDQVLSTDGAGVISFVDLPDGEAVKIACKNTTASTITKGTPVYITGTVGASFIVQIAPADAANSAKMPAVGLLETDLAANGQGFIVTGGLLKNLTTDPIDGTTPSSNDTIYVKAGGGLTMTKPTGSNLIQNIGKVGRVNSSNAGSIVVSSILRTNDVPNLTEGKIWVGSVNNTEESTVVHIDETNTRIGINQNTPDVTLDITGTDAIQIPKGTDAERPTPESGMFRFNTTSSEFEGYNGTEWAPVGGANAASIDIDAFTGDGTTTAFTLTSEISQEDNTQVYIDGVYQSKANYTTSGTTLTFSTAPPTGTAIEVVNFTGIQESQMDGSGTANYVTKWLDSDTLTDSIITDDGSTVTVNGDAIVTGDLTVDTNTLYVDSTNNRVGIGTDLPQVELDIASGAPQIRLTDTDGGYCEVVNASGNLLLHADKGNTQSSSYMRFEVDAIERMRIESGGDISFRDTSNNEAFYWDASAARLGIGVGASPAYPLDILGSRIRLKSTTGNAPLLDIESWDTGSFYFGVDNPSGTAFGNGANARNIYSTGNYDLVISTNSTEAIRVAASSVTYFTRATKYLLINPNYGGSNTHVQLQADSGMALAFATNGDNERMRIDSSGRVGINETNPSTAKLVIETGPTSGIDLYRSAVNANFEAFRFRDSSNANTEASIGWGGDQLRLNSTNNTVFTTGGTERMRIDSSGNVGVGTTSPNSFNPGANKLVVGDGGNYQGMTINSIVEGNIYFADGTTSAQTYEGVIGYNHTNNFMHFYTNHTERMRIDSSGRVGIGMTPSNYTGYSLQLNGGTQCFMSFGNSTTGTGALNGLVIGNDSTGADIYQREAQPLRFHTDDTERMRIDSSGNVGIGTTFTSAKLQIENTNAGASAVALFLNNESTSLNTETRLAFAANTNNDIANNRYSYISALNTSGSNGQALIFATNEAGAAAVERMRIDSSGNVLVQAQSVAAAGLSIRPNATAGTVQQVFNRASTTSTSYIFDFQNAGTTVGYISYNNTSTNYNTSSDYRLKENVVELTGALDRVDQLEPKRFNFIANADKTVDGFLAHEVAEVVPEAISGEKDAVDEEGNAIYQGIDQSKLVPLLTAALQEAHTLIKDLTARIETLENQ